MKNTIVALAVLTGVVVFYLLLKKKPIKEHYRDPIYLNRAKLIYDWYPRANGSIYGFPYRYGGSWSIFSGYPYYDRAY